MAASVLCGFSRFATCSSGRDLAECRGTRNTPGRKGEIPVTGIVVVVVIDGGLKGGGGVPLVDCLPLERY
jgi:hypothetical protein